MKHFLILPAFLLLTACAGVTPPDKAADVETAFTAVLTAWVGYLNLPDCTTPNGMAAKPLCSDTAVIAKGAPIREAAFAKVEAYHAAANDPNAPTSAVQQAASDATAAIGAFQAIVNALPKKGV